MMTGPARGRRKRATTLRALLACLALTAFEGGLAQAQTLTSDLLRPVPDGFLSPQDSLLRKTANNSSVDPTESAIDPTYDDRLRGKNTRAPSRIGQVPSYGLPAASAAMPLPSASSVRSAEATAAFAGSVPDEFVISGFGLAISNSREMRASVFAPKPSLARPNPRCDAEPAFSTGH